MLKSMTGFGAAGGTVEGVDYTVEIKSVNNRHLKLSLRLPDSLASLETEIEQLLKSRLQRGSVMLGVRMKIPDEQAVYRVNSAVLMSYLEQLRPLEVEANPMLRLDIGSLLQLPGVCKPPPLDELAEKTADGLMGLIEEALDAMVKMRETEGRAIADDMKKNTKQIEENLTGIEARTDDVLQLYHERLTARVEQLTAQAKIDIDTDTLAREVAIFAERSDIAEEVSRLSQHLKEFEKMFQATDPIGRKLDFMSQEMLREANTIASKVSDAEIARVVVEIKTAIDRIKEQAANVE